MTWTDMCRLAVTHWNSLIWMWPGSQLGWAISALGILLSLPWLVLHEFPRQRNKGKEKLWCFSICCKLSASKAMSIGTNHPMMLEDYSHMIMYGYRGWWGVGTRNMIIVWQLCLWSRWVSLKTISTLHCLFGSRIHLYSVFHLGISHASKKARQVLNILFKFAFHVYFYL